MLFLSLYSFFYMLLLVSCSVFGVCFLSCSLLAVCCVLCFFGGSLFFAYPNLRIQGRMPIFAKIIKIEVPRPRDYAHRVERKKLIQITGVKIAVGVLKVGFVKKQVFGQNFGPNVVFETLYCVRPSSSSSVRPSVPSVRRRRPSSSSSVRPSVPSVRRRPSSSPTCKSKAACKFSKNSSKQRSHGLGTMKFGIYAKNAADFLGQN